MLNRDVSSFTFNESITWDRNNTRIGTIGNYGDDTRRFVTSMTKRDTIFKIGEDHNSFNLNFLWFQYLKMEVTVMFMTVGLQHLIFRQLMSATFDD